MSKSEDIDKILEPVLKPGPDRHDSTSGAATRYRDAWAAGAVGLLLFAFPLFAIPVRHWASVVYVLIGLVALFSLRRPQPPLSHEERVFIGLLILYVTVTVIANSFSGWMRGSVRWFEPDARFLLAVPIYLYLRTHVDIALNLVRGLPVAAVIAGVYVLYETSVAGQRVAGPYGPIFAGNIAALLAILSLSTIGVDSFRARVRIPLHLLGFALGVAAAVLSGTRSAWLAVAVAVPVAIFLMVRDASAPRRAKTVAWGAVALLGVVIAATAAIEPKLTQKRFVMAIDQAEEFLGAEGRSERAEAAHSSVGLRLEQWRIGLLIFSDNPLFGVGVGNIGMEINRRVDAGLASPAIAVEDADEGKGSHLHSAFMDALVFKGAFGLATLLGVLLYPAWLALRPTARGSAARTFVLLCTVVFVVFSLTEDPFIRNNFTSVFLVVTTCGVALLLAGPRAGQGIA